MTTLGRVWAMVVALLLGSSGASMYLCAQSAAPVCPPKAAHEMCHDETTTASVSCCCTIKDVPTQPPATAAASVPVLEPVAQNAIAWLGLSAVALRSIDVTP